MNIKEIRGKLLMTQQEFADAIGVTRAVISSWENEKSMPSFKNKKKIIEFCKEKGEKL